MNYTKLTNLEVENLKASRVAGNVAGDINGNIIGNIKTLALTVDSSVNDNVVILSSVTASKVLTVNVPNGSLFIVVNKDANNAATIKCGATDVGATLAKSTSGIYYNANGVATLLK